MSQRNGFMLIVCGNTNWTNLNIRLRLLMVFFKYHKFVWTAANCFHFNVYNILLVVFIIYIKYYRIAYLHNDSLPRWSRPSTQYTFTYSCIFFQIPFPPYISFVHNQLSTKCKFYEFTFLICPESLTCWLS